jgi:ketosteroid isomerase-like protein
MKEMPMKATIAAVALIAATLMAPTAWADPADEVRATYNQFAAAQNARDIDKVRAVLLDSPQFLWISDGMAIWGRDAVLQRMALFQEAETWHVEPALNRAVPVEVSDTTAFLHLPLALTIGKGAAPETFRFLVDVLCVKTAQGWRIAALFTTADNTK